MDTVIKTLEFVSSFEAHSKKLIEVVVSDDSYQFNDGEFVTTIDFVNQTLIRKNADVIMHFDFVTKQGFILLIAFDNKMLLSILNYNLEITDNKLKLEFTYELANEEVFIKLAIGG